MRLDRLAVLREASVLDDAAPFEQPHRARYATVEWHRQLELVGANAESRARQRDALGVAGELELWLRRRSALKLDVAIAEDEDAPARDAPVHAPRHLQNLVRAEVHAA
jgi:hypothetical protein